MPKSTLPLRAGELDLLLVLATLDSQIRETARTEQEIIRKLNEHRVGMETLSRFIEEDRVRLARRFDNDAERERLEKAISERHREIAHLAQSFEIDEHRAVPALDRLRQIQAKASAERDALVGRLEHSITVRYEYLVTRDVLGFIVPVRDGRCTGCALVLVAALIERVSSPDVIGACPRCERLLYGPRPKGRVAL